MLAFVLRGKPKNPEKNLQSHAMRARQEPEKSTRISAITIFVHWHHQSDEEKQYKVLCLEKHQIRTKSKAQHLCGSSLKGRLFHDLQKLFSQEREHSAECYWKMNLALRESPTGKPLKVHEF